MGILFLSSLLMAEISNAQPQVENLMKEFQKTKVSLNKDEVKQRKILAALYEVNHKMKKIVTEKAELEQEKMAVEGNVKELAVKITELEKKAKLQKSHLRERLSAIYKLGGQGIARVLFASSSSAELDRNLKILGIVAKKDIALIKDYSQSRKDLEQRKQKLTLRWAHLKKLEAKITGKEQKLAEENELKNKILKGIRNSQKFAQMKIKFLRKKGRQIASDDEAGLLDLLFQPSFSDQKGHLPRPIQAPLAQGYGLIRDEAHQVVLSHKGQFFRAPTGSLVKAVFQGKVAYAGDVPGFGRTLILDHGDHYYSVYSHNQAFKVREGDEVQQSQTLALSGSAGAEKGEGLYFEIRHFSEPSDPKLWMKGSTL
ncbi:MAG: murein hydrolase activator EnvC [Pseudobdellovibrionaceae bacterium]